MNVAIILIISPQMCSETNNWEMNIGTETEFISKVQTCALNYISDPEIISFVL